MLFSSEQFNGILTLVPVSRVIFTVIRARVNRTYSIGRYRPIVDSSEWTKRGKKKEKKKNDRITPISVHVLLFPLNSFDQRLTGVVIVFPQSWFYTLLFRKKTCPISNYFYSSRLDRSCINWEGNVSSQFPPTLTTPFPRNLSSFQKLNNPHQEDWGSGTMYLFSEFFIRNLSFSSRTTPLPSLPKIS